MFVSLVIDWFCIGRNRMTREVFQVTGIIVTGTGGRFGMLVVKEVQGFATVEVEETTLVTDILWEVESIRIKYLLRNLQ